MTRISQDGHTKALFSSLTVSFSIWFINSVDLVGTKLSQLGNFIKAIIEFLCSWLPVVRHGFGEQVFDVLDSGLVGGVGAEEFRRPGAFLAGGLVL
jgi:hypothetical protein